MTPLEELDDSTRRTRKLARAGLMWNCSIPITNTKGSYLYPCSNMTPSRPRLQHLLPKLMPRCNVRLAPVINSSLLYAQATSSRIPECFLFQAWNSSSVEWWRTPDRRRLYRMLWGKPLAEWCSPTKLGPQVSLFPVPIFGVNTSFPWMKSLSLWSGRGKFTLATWKPPLSSPLIYFSYFKYSNPRGIPRKRCSRFLVIPSLKEMANIER
jgi:hypothetical protein